MITRERVGTEIGLMTGRIKKTFRNGKDNISSLQTSVMPGCDESPPARQRSMNWQDAAWNSKADWPKRSFNTVLRRQKIPLAMGFIS